MEFKVDGYDNLEFREIKASPVELLAITTQIDFDKFTQTKELYTFVLEHIEVKQGEKWFPVKVKGKESYAIGVEEDLQLLQLIINWYTENVLLKAFQKSSE